MKKSSLLKPLRDIRHWAFYNVILERNLPLTTLGTEATGCHWTFTGTLLGPESVVYSGGAGRDITFELELIEKYGCSVFLFDPSPTGTETMALPENHHPRLKFFPVGLAGTTGEIFLKPPINEEEGSWFESGDAGAGALSFVCRDLKGLMQELGHTKIDLLKIDIEGAEYGVLESVVKDGLEIDQICVEYHHGMMPGISRGQTLRSLISLLKAGYRFTYKVGNNHTFVHKRLLRRLKG